MAQDEIRKPESWELRWDEPKLRTILSDLQNTG